MQRGFIVMLMSRPTRRQIASNNKLTAPARSSVPLDCHPSPLASCQ